VNGKTISRETLDLHMKERIEEHKKQNVSIDEKKLRDAIVQELISERITLDEAASKGITASEADVSKEVDTIRNRVGDESFQKQLKEKGMTVDSFRKRMKEKMIMTKFIEGFAKESDISEQEMNDYYRNSPKPFFRPARVNMKVVEFQSEDAARAAADDLRKGLDFDEYAKKLSVENKAVVSDYGWVSPDFFTPDMAASIKGLKDGQHGGPYKGQTGFYLVRVKERQAEGVAAYDEVKEMIRSSLLQQKRMDAYLKWLDQKRIAAKIVINLS
jgi:parvulin-like peptidyl-prolyl isomerase